MRVERFDGAAAVMLDEARRRGLYVIARFQDVEDRTLVVNDGAVERAVSGRTAGVGVQVITSEGWSGFAASDDASAESARGLVARAGSLARASGVLDPEINREVFDLPGDGRRVVPRRAPELGAVSLADQTHALCEANRALKDVAAGLPVRSAHVVVDDEWRVVRSDGTDVSFPLPRAYVRHDLTIRSSDGRTTLGATLSGADSRVLLAPENVAALDRRTRAAFRRARAVLGAPRVRAGSYKLAIDHALAKGLAHEAFGHACETDVVEISILATGGRLRLGEEVGPRSVSIVDGPIPGDYADQPISANGLERQTVTIIRDGVLESGLGDLFSARPAGSPVTGACRTGSYRQRPTPRMTNIRMVVSDPLPLPAETEDPEPEEVAAALRAGGLVEPGEPVLYLSGYRGGQAHPKNGDFMFACSGTYDLTDGVAPRRPATFSGRSLSALRSVTAALGELRLDALGSCGKNGQYVPTSGGSHAVVVLEVNPHVTVGSQT
jgi:TldD protein